MAIRPLFMAGAPRAPVKVPSRGRDRQKWYLPGPFPDGPGIGAETINLGRLEVKLACTATSEAWAYP
jgi:hypothetical protein